MTSFEWIILIVIGLSIFIGYRKGLLKQLGSFCALFAAIALSRLLNKPLAQWMLKEGYLKIDESDTIFNNEFVINTISAVLIFLIVYIITRIVFKWIKLTFQTLHISILDRISGAVFTTFLSLLFFSLILNLIQLFKTDGVIVKSNGIMGEKGINAIMGLAPMTFGYTVTLIKDFEKKKENIDIKSPISQDEK